MRRPPVLFFLALALEIALFALLNWFDDWSVESLPAKFVTVAILCGFAYLFAVSQFSFFAVSRKAAVLFWSVSILLRLIALPMAPSDDLWRYQWEGKVQQAGFNPYVSAPDAPELEPLRASFPDWGRINHRDFRAIYPPGTELLFWGLSRISNSPLLYKLVFALGDIGVIGVLLLLMGGESRFANVAWYAWNPLVAYSFAGAAHFDSWMILPLMTGIWFLLKYAKADRSEEKWMWATAAAVVLGFAISIKLIPALLLLCFAFALGKRAIVLGISLVIPGLLGLLYGYPKVPIWESLGQFIYVTRLNDLFWWVIEDTIWPNWHQKNYQYNVIIIVVALFISVLFFRNWKRGALWTLGSALILSPVLHPWYCTWILPLATWRRAYAWHMLSVSLFAYYLFWSPRLFELPWRTEPWLRALVIVPPLLALAFAILQKRNGGDAAVRRPEAES